MRARRRHPPRGPADNGLRLVTETHAARAVGEHRRLADARLAPRSRPRDAASRTSSSTCSSRAPTTRSAEDIAQAIDSIGGQLDAFTVEGIRQLLHQGARRAPAAGRRPAVATSCCSPPSRGRHRAREEGRSSRRSRWSRTRPTISCTRSSPQQFWAGHPLGRPILGDARDASRRSTATALRDYFAGHLRRAEPDRRGRRQPRARPRPRPGRARPSAGLAPRRPPAEETAPGDHAAEVIVRTKDLEQSHVCLGTAGLSAGARRPLRGLRAEHDARRLDELAAVPEHPREARPGLRGVQRPQRVPRRRRCSPSTPAAPTTPSARWSTSSWPKLRALQGTTRSRPSELQRAKDHLKGSLMLSLESTSSRMSHLARQEIYFDPAESLDETLARHRARDAPTTCSASPQRLCSATARSGLTVLGGGDAHVARGDTC